MQLTRLGQHQLLFVLDLLVPYVVLVVVLSGAASYIHIQLLMTASGLVMTYALGVLLVKWIVEVGGAGLKSDEGIPFVFVSGVILVVLIGTAAFVLWPARALLLARILLGLTGTLLCAATLVKRIRARWLSPCAQVTKVSVPAKPHGPIAFVWLLLLIGLIAFLGQSREGAERFTELFLADSEISPCSSAQASRDVWCIDIQVGTVNHENEPTEYTLAFQTPSNKETLDPFTLRDGEIGMANIQIPVSVCEQKDANVDAVLYKGSTSPYRSIRLSCAFLSSSGRVGD
jgi:hypothetical protein